MSVDMESMRWIFILLLSSGAGRRTGTPDSRKGDRLAPVSRPYDPAVDPIDSVRTSRSSCRRLWGTTRVEGEGVTCVGPPSPTPRLRVESA